VPQGGNASRLAGEEMTAIDEPSVRKSRPQPDLPRQLLALRDPAQVLPDLGRGIERPANEGRRQDHHRLNRHPLTMLGAPHPLKSLDGRVPAALQTPGEQHDVVEASHVHRVIARCNAVPVWSRRYTIAASSSGWR
jgi:hypothetical protein